MFACPAFYRNYRKVLFILLIPDAWNCAVKTLYSISIHILLNLFFLFMLTATFWAFLESWFEGSGCRSHSNSHSPIPLALPAKNESGIWITISHSWICGFRTCQGTTDTWFQRPISFRYFQLCIKVHLSKDHLIDGTFYKAYRHNWFQGRIILTENISVPVFLLQVK